MWKRTLAIIIAMLTLTRVAASQSVGKMLSDDFKNTGRDIGAIWTAPFDASGHDWLLTGAALGAFGVSMLADQSVSDWALRNDSSAFFEAISPLRRGGKLFAGKYVVPPVAVAYIVGIATKNQDVRDAVMGCMASWGAQSVVRKTLYLLVGRARPDTIPNDPQVWKVPSGGSWEMHSFPAGHFANAMGCASFWNNRFHLGVGEVAIYALAGAVGVGRLADGAHWTSDTVLGGILGYAVGKEIARRSLSRSATASASKTAQMFLAPELGRSVIGLRFTF
jgi:membrane-associated phospholipid phosphatase